MRSRLYIEERGVTLAGASAQLLHRDPERGVGGRGVGGLNT